jgi:hypothetical protein
LQDFEGLSLNVSLLKKLIRASCDPETNGLLLLPQRRGNLQFMTALEAQWSPVKNLILGEDPQLRNYAEACVWYRKIEQFRKGEEQRMFAHDPTPEDLAVHKSLLQRLLIDGEHLVVLIQRIGLPENTEGITPESVSITLEALRADFRGWHQPMPPERRKQLLKELFPDVA